MTFKIDGILKELNDLSIINENPQLFALKIDLPLIYHYACLGNLPSYNNHTFAVMQRGEHHGKESKEGYIVKPNDVDKFFDKVYL